MAIWIFIKRGYYCPRSNLPSRWLDRVSAAWVYLGKEAIHDDGHTMMLAKNSDAVAARIENWVYKALPERAASR